MKFKSIVFAFILFSLFSANAFAHGKKDIEEMGVENLNSWQESFDIEGKKKGKYNIMITATDLGGNTYIEGPHNIRIDPDSDLCIPSITNPFNGMRVVGNLNIVGTCIDDDGVDYIELVLDGDEESPIIADGAEFWSYYLDTTDLEEGTHTIKVTGYDINGLKGKTATLLWQLDRRQPVTSVKEKDMETDRAMGVLVSGNVHFAGLVEDGNGIKSLSYSLDNGEHFLPLKIKTNKKLSNATFDVQVNTRDFPDGPTVIWFKAVDNAGSVGVYSFLYYIDNTKPDVQIISPEKDETVNGKFSVAGFAKDKVGISELIWTFGSETGSIDLIPGNPYWCLNFDTIGAGSKEKSRKFSIKAIDRANNVVEVSQNILLDQESDKPVVTISEPAQDKQFFGSEEIFVRGISVDDDNMQAVKIAIDDGEPEIQETKGVFYKSFGNASDYEFGKHKITVTGIDVNGVEGNPTVVNIAVLDIAPKFDTPRITSGKHDPIPFVNGIEVHPEEGASFNVNISSATGIKSVHTEYLCGDSEPIETDIELKNIMNHTAVIPISQSRPVGVVKLRVVATDTWDRQSEFTGLMLVTNITDIKNAPPVVVFDDSIVDSEGRIINNKEFPATGYLFGDIAVDVELIPETPFATARLYGNQIQLNAGNEVGTSEPVIVRVTTARGDKIDSIPLTFVNDTELPSLTINRYSPSAAGDLYKDPLIKISGNAKCKTGMNKVKYRLLSASVEMAKGVIGKQNNPETPAEFKNASLSNDGSFSIEIDSSSLSDGFYIVEVVAESSAGNLTTKGVAYKKIPEIVADEKGKFPNPKAPAIVWFDGVDVYAAAVYQGNISESFTTFPRSEMIEGNNALTWNTTADDGKSASGKYTASKDPTLSAHFATVNGEQYRSGMFVELPYGNDKSVEAGNVVAYIDTGATVNSVSYEIYGDDVPGGDIKQTGNAKLTKPQAGETRWIAEIPLKNLPVRVTKIKLNIKAGSLETSLEGTLQIVRPSESVKVEDQKKIYTLPSVDMTYNALSGQYVMTPESKFYYYANLPSPISVELESETDGLEIKTEGNLITLTAIKDANYENVKIHVTDIFGDVYTSEEVDFLGDCFPPDLTVLTPELHDWEGNIVNISGTAADTIGLELIEYSLDGGETWTDVLMESSDDDLDFRGVTFSEYADISGLDDGLVPVDVRATDRAGNVVVKRTAIFKDTTPPEVNVVLPLDSDVVNGETTVVFKANDNGFLASANYIAPPISLFMDEPDLTEDEGLESENPEEDSLEKEEKTEIESTRVVAHSIPKVTEIELGPLTAMLVGTEDCPIDDIMSFEFYDDAGNKTNIEAWQFLIDNESDLPIAEIHLPEYNQVLTRDFTISGVVYDDDGDCDIYYKIDDGEYIHYPKQGSSFAIDIPLNTMTDNEHTVTVYAVDINGVQGLETVQPFRISLEEPKGAVTDPKIDISVRGLVTISGWASDKNGIATVQVSLDNGNSYNDAIIVMNEGPDAEWSYTFDSRAIPGGTQVVFLKITDNYEIQGLNSSLVNIDNEAPVLALDFPADDTTTTGMLFFSGYSYDNVEIVDMHVTIRNIEEPGEPFVEEFPIERVIGRTLDIRSLENGFYNVELTAVDKAGNTSNASRNIHLEKYRNQATVDLLYPLNGEYKNYEFNIYGQAESEREIKSLMLYIDGSPVLETSLTSSGFFRFLVDQEILSDGEHSYYVEAILDSDETVLSRPQTITYSTYGPWVTIDNFSYGDFAYGRPYLQGRAGYAKTKDETTLAMLKDAPKELKDAEAAKRVEKIELSFDNGKSFIPLSQGDKWRYRVENQDLEEGYHFLLLRATMKNGETAIERTIVQIDNTKPTIRLIAPSVGGSYNQELAFSGLSSDDVELDSVTLALRKGDKSSYEVPSGLQGLYVDFSFWGATLFDLGVGLTAFGDIVKIQAHWGQFTQAQRNSVSEAFKIPMTNFRYGGNVVGLKILANIYTVPFSYFLGHDWEWLYANFAVGANFSWFSETNSGVPQILSALIGQVEFPRMHFTGLKMFSTIAMYTEMSVWFIPSDVSSNVVKINTIIPQFSVGLRVNIF